MKTAILIITSLILLGTMVICAMANKIIIRLNEVRAFYEGITIYPNVRHLCKDCFKKIT